MNRFLNSFIFNEKEYFYYDLKKVFQYFPKLKNLPNSLKILLEAGIRNLDGKDIDFLIENIEKHNRFYEIPFFPNRAIVDEKSSFNIVSSLINNEFSIKIFLDVILSSYDYKNSDKNSKYNLLKTALKDIQNLSVVPPNSNLEEYINIDCLSTLINLSLKDEKIFVYPELVISDSSKGLTSGALGVLSFYKNSLDIKKALLNYPLSVGFPKVIGIEIKGSFRQGVLFKDLKKELEIILKEYTSKNCVIEFFGDEIGHIHILNRKELVQLLIEMGFNAVYFNIDENTFDYLIKTRDVDLSLVNEYFKHQDLLSIDKKLYDEVLTINLSNINLNIPKLKDFNSYKKGSFVKDNDIVFAKLYFSKSSILSFIQTAILIKKINELQIKVNRYVKMQLVIDSFLVQKYLQHLKLFDCFNEFGFEILENDCEIQTNESVKFDVEKYNLSVVAVSNYQELEKIKTIKQNLCIEPALIISYLIKGNINFDILKEPLFKDIYLLDIWTNYFEVNEYLKRVNYDFYKKIYQNILCGDEYWKGLDKNSSENITYIKNSNYKKDTSSSFFINEGKVVAIYENIVSQEDIFQNGKITPYSIASKYLQENRVTLDEFDTYEQRELNDEIVKRATLISLNLKNRIVSPKEGGYTKNFDTKEILSIYDFCTQMKKENKELIIFAEKNFGKGDFNEYCIKGLALLGIKAIIAESFDEEFKKSMLYYGIMPLKLLEDDIKNLNISGKEIIELQEYEIKINQKLDILIKDEISIRNLNVQILIENELDMFYFKEKNIL